MFKMMFLFVSVLLSFSVFAGGTTPTLSRESIGDIEGILKDEKTWAAHELVAEQCSGLLIPDTILGGTMTSTEVFNDKTKKKFCS